MSMDYEIENGVNMYYYDFFLNEEGVYIKLDLNFLLSYEFVLRDYFIKERDFWEFQKIILETFEDRFFPVKLRYIAEHKDEFEKDFCEYLKDLKSKVDIKFSSFIDKIIEKIESGNCKIFISEQCIAQPYNVFNC